MTEILPNLWLGNYEITKSKDFINLHKINTIINCTNTFPFPEHFKGKRIRVPVLDNKKPNQIWKMFKYFDLVHQIINKERARNSNILIHCQAGKQRSVSIVLAYLMSHGKISLNNAYLLLQTKHCNSTGIPLNNLNFKWSLEQYSKYLGMEN